MSELVITADVISRFWNNANKEGEIIKEGMTNCWEWKLRVDKDGFGSVTISKKTMTAHRFAKIITSGEIPEGYVVVQNCKNKKCINPDHLECVTRKESIARGKSPWGINASKTHCKNGHPFTDENTSSVKMKSGEYGRGCKTCLNEYRTAYSTFDRKEKPTKEVLENLLLTRTLVDVGNEYGVSYQTICNWLKSYDIKDEG